MTRSPAKLHVLKAADEVEETDDTGRPMVAVTEVGPEEGRLAHPAIHGKRQRDAQTRFEAEAELVGFVCDLLDAPADAPGVVTPGVNDAALLVMRAARKAHPHQSRPTVVLPQSAHPAYFAAAATVGLRPRVVPLDGDGRAVLGALVGAIDDSTVLIVASAPSFTHGVADPIAWIAAASAARDVRLHVDATSGGWALAYAERAGRVGPTWTFAVYGVDSIAVDAGPDRGGPADLTVLVHRDPAAHRDLRASAWSRGPVEVPPAWLPASRLLTDVTVTARELGHQGCGELALDALQATAHIVEGLEEISGVQVVARPDSTTITLRTDTTCDAFTFSDALYRRGWAAQPVLPEVGQPLLRLAVTPAMREAADEFLEAAAEAVDDARERGRAQLDATLERLLETLDPRDVGDYAVHLLLDAAAVLDEAGHEGEGRRAQVNLLLANAPIGVREVLHGVHLDRLSRPVRSGQEVVVSTISDTDDSE